MLWNRGLDVKVIDSNDGDYVCAQAVKENRIFLTSNLKLFNKKVSVPRGCLHYKAPPKCKFQIPIIESDIDQFKALAAYFNI